MASRLERRVAAGAEAALEAQQDVSPVDVLVGIGWLPSASVAAWRQGRIDALESGAAVGPDRLADALALLRRWAERQGLQPREVAYIARTRDRRPLRFTAAGAPELEAAYRTHWLAPALSEKQRERLVERQSRPPELVVVWPLKDWTCACCGEAGGGFLVMEAGSPVCLPCADLGHLVYLPSGDAALTRRAKKASGLSAVVVRWSRTRRRYERQGLLVEEAALERAELECLGDAEARSRRRERAGARRGAEELEFQAAFARAILAQFPGCPPARAEAIARHAGARGSGRVGRSAAGRALAPGAVAAAVAAAVRHEDTGYDKLRMAGLAREEARARVAPQVEAILDRWAGPKPTHVSS